MKLIDTIDVLTARGLTRVRGRAALLLSAACWLLGASSAAAQECQADADCGPGYTCATGQGGGCSSGPCTPDGVCPPPVCETFEYRYCDMAPCVTDADCPESMRCHTERWQECSGWAGPTCARDEVCDAGPAPEPTCTEHTRSACAERYNLPCEADADCGSGFECTESVSTSCSGGGSVRPDGDGGYVVETFPAECTSEPTGEYYCKLLDLPCATDAECPEGFSCEANFTMPSCASGGSSLGGTGAGTPAVVDCGTPPAPTYACEPPRYGGGGVVGGSGTGGTGSGSGGDPNGSADAGVQGPGSGSVGGVGGAGGGAAGGTGAGDAGASPPDDGEAEEDGHGHGARRVGRLLRRLLGPGGCSLTGAVPAGDLSWLALASLLAGGALRRRRACGTR